MAIKFDISGNLRSLIEKALLVGEKKSFKDKTISIVATAGAVVVISKYCISAVSRFFEKLPKPDDRYSIFFNADGTATRLTEATRDLATAAGVIGLVTLSNRQFILIVTPVLASMTVFHLSLSADSV